MLSGITSWAEAVSKAAADLLMPEFAVFTDMRRELVEARRELRTLGFGE